MKRFDRNVSATKAALQETPEIFHSVCVNLTAHILGHVINGLVNESLFFEPVVTRGALSV
jgi:hypothetical protein